jgi:hypothetical protein
MKVELRPSIRRCGPRESFPSCYVCSPCLDFPNAMITSSNLGTCTGISAGFLENAIDIAEADATCPGATCLSRCPRACGKNIQRFGATAPCTSYPLAHAAVGQKSIAWRAQMAMPLALSLSTTVSARNGWNFSKRLLRTWCASLGVEVSALNRHSEIPGVIAGFARGTNSGLIVIASVFAVRGRDLIIADAAKRKLPTSYYGGALISYGPNWPDQSRRAGGRLH